VLGGVKIEYIKNPHSLRTIKIFSWFIIVIFICSGFLHSIFFYNDLYSVDAASSWTQTSDKDFNINGTFNNTTVVGNTENAELQIDLSELDYWKKQSPGFSPNSRGYNVMASISGDDKIILFGGGSGMNIDNDTWEYDFSNDTWTEKTPNPKTAANNPGRNYFSKMASSSRYKTILFGGVSGDDTWEYDSRTGSWTDVSKPNRPSKAGHAMSSVYDEDKVVLFSGGGLSVVFGDTWVYDSNNGSWEEKNPSSKPTARGECAMAPIFGTSKVLLFGGRTWTNTYLSDTWVYDINNDTWTNLQPSNSKPSPRSYHEMASIYGDDKVVLLGGSPEQHRYLDDTWVYDLSDNAWTKIIPRSPTNKPTYRANFGLATIYQKDRTVLFGGISTGGSQLGDTWIFQYPLPQKNGTYISIPYDTGSRSSFKKLSWHTETPDNSTIKLQLRSANNDSALIMKDFVGPNGTASTFYTSSPTDIWSGHDGDRWIQYKAYFNIMEVTVSPSLKDVTITYNCLPETIVLAPTNGSLLSNNKPVFKWSFSDYDSENQRAFQILIDDDINFTGVDFDSGEQITTDPRWEFPMGTNYTELPDGTWYWKVRTKDEDDEWIEYSSAWMIRIDTHAPTSAPDIPVNNGFYYSLPRISGIAFDATSGFGLNKIEIAINRLTDNSYWNGTAWVPLVSWLLATGTTKWTFDSSNVFWTSGIKYSVQSRATDNASNIEQPNVMNIFTIDMEIPKSKIEIPKYNNWLNRLNSISGNAVDIGGSSVKEVKINIKCTKDYASSDAGAKENEYWDGSNWTKSEIWLLANGTQMWSYNTSKILLKTGDHYTIRSRAIDLTGNMETAGPKTTFKYDIKPPDDLDIYINNGEAYTATTGAVLSLSAEDVGSGVSQMSFCTDGLIWSPWESFNSTRSFNLQTGDGEKTISFRVRDSTGNIAEPVSESIFLDTTPPQSLTVMINEGEKYSRSKQVKLDLKAIDTGTGLSELTYSLDGTNWQPWEDFKDAKHINFESGDGEKTVFFKANDKVGNIAKAVTDSIILDTISPYSLSIVINNGASETNSTTVNLKLKAIDNTSGVSQVSFSTDGETWTAWETFYHDRYFTLPPINGEKTIYFKVKDKAGNIAKPVHASILLNITTPEEELKTIKTQAAGNEFWNYIIFMMIILVILILFIIALASVVMKKKNVEQELLLLKAVTVKPDALTGTVISPASTRISAVPVQAQLPAIGAASVAQQPTVQTASTPAVPPKPIPATPQLPLLPPAQSDETKLEVQDTTPKPVPMVVTSQPQQTTIDRSQPLENSMPTVTLSQETIPSSASKVHLPESPQPTLVKIKPQENLKKGSNIE